MAAREWIVDPGVLDFDHVVADIEAIRAVIPQRHHMEALTAIVYDDVERHVCVGYRDITNHEFWVSGHMPGLPLMPGVIMCEAAAQVLSYHVQAHDLAGAKVVGFGGLDKVRFRGIVKPGDRLGLSTKGLKHRPGRPVICKFEEVVGTNIVCEGEITGIPLPVDELAKAM